MNRLQNRQPSTSHQFSLRPVKPDRLLVDFIPVRIYTSSDTGILPVQGDSQLPVWSHWILHFNAQRRVTLWIQSGF
jgi:hypothetical protein